MGSESKKINIKTEQIHGIDMSKLAMAEYASYYIGAKALDPTIDSLSTSNLDLTGRAINTFNMTEPMKKAFSGPNGMIVIDDSDNWSKRDPHAQQGKGYFVTVYDPESKKFIIASPGMESDNPEAVQPRLAKKFNGAVANVIGGIERGLGSVDQKLVTAGRMLQDVGDTAFNWEDGAKGTTFLNQTKQELAYIKELERQLKNGGIDVQVNGKTQHLSMQPNEDVKSRVVLAAHSAATLPAQTLAGIGFDAFLIEPRPLDQNLVNREIKNLSDMRIKITPENFKKNLEDGVVNLRNSVRGLWNDKGGGPGEFSFDSPGRDLVYHIKDNTVADNFIMGAHRVEVSVPGMLGIAGAKAYDGAAAVFEGVPGSKSMATGQALLDSAQPKPATSQSLTMSAVAPS